MITKVLLLTLMQQLYFILFYRLAGSKMRTNFKYTGSNFDECLNSCNSYDKALLPQANAVK